MSLTQKFQTAAALKNKTLAQLHSKLDLAMKQALMHPRHSMERIAALASIQNIQRAIAVLMSDRIVDFTYNLFF
jgi:hypothetical protein